MSWPLVTLADVGTFRAGFGFPNKFQGKQSGDYPFAKVGDISVIARAGGKYISKAGNYLDDAELKEVKAKPVPAGAIVFAKIGEAISQNFRAITSVEMLIDNNAMALVPDLDKVDTDYLYHFMCKLDLYPYAGATTVPSLRKSVLEGIQIPLPPLPEQKRIAAILDKADAIRRKRQQAIQLADDLLRAVFLDMFGDPVTNPKGWPVEHLKDITTKIGSGSTPRGGSEAYLDQGISLIRSLNIHDDDFRMKNLAFIDDEQAEKLSNVLVQNGDVLLNITGASVCRCAIVPAAVLPARVNQHVCIIRPSDAVNSSYLLHLLISEPYKQKLLKMSGAGATREALTKQQVEMLEVPIPPKDLQIKFEEIKDKVRSLSSASDSFKEESIFESLSDKAFSGLL